MRRENIPVVVGSIAIFAGLAWATNWRLLDVLVAFLPPPDLVQAFVVVGFMYGAILAGIMFVLVLVALPMAWWERRKEPRVDSFTSPAAVRPAELPRRMSWAEFVVLMRTWTLLALLSVVCEVVLLAVKGPYPAGEFGRLIALFLAPAMVSFLPAYAGRWDPKRFPGLKTGVVGVLFYALLLAFAF